MKSRLSKFLNFHGGLIYIATGNLLGALLAAALWLSLAYLQDPTEYGRINYEISLGSVLASFALLGFNTTVSLYSGKGLTPLNIQANQMVLITTLIAASIAMALFSNWLIAIFILSMNFWVMSTHGLLGKRSYAHYSISIIGARALQLVLSISLYFLFGITGIIVGFVIAFIIFSYPYFATFRRFSLNFQDVRSKIKYSLHVYSFNMSNALVLYFDKLIIGPLFGYAILGQYQLAFQFMMFFGVIPISFYQYLIPEESSGRKDPKLSTVGFVISILLAILMFVISPWILKVFFNSYIESITPTQILSLGIVPMMIVFVINSKFITTGTTRPVLVGVLIYQIIQIVLFIYLGNYMGVNGLASAVVLALSFQALFLYLSRKFWIERK